MDFCQTIRSLWDSIFPTFPLPIPSLPFSSLFPFPLSARHLLQLCRHCLDAVGIGNVAIVLVQDDVGGNTVKAELADDRARLVRKNGIGQPVRLAERLDLIDRVALLLNREGEHLHAFALELLPDLFL